MAASDDVIDDFFSERGHESEPASWQRAYNKKQCPDCGGLHDTDATTCSVCGWAP